MKKKPLSEMSLEELWELFPIILKEYNKDYPKWYQEEKQKLDLLFQNNEVLRINHIGSSAVENLISKPIIDILLEINKTQDIDYIGSILINNGWTPMNKEEKPVVTWSFNKGYTSEGFAKRVYHLHVRYLDDWEELYFRDYLIAHLEVREEYGKLKLSLLEKYKHDRDGYTNAKTEFIMNYSKKAKEEFQNKYKPY